jgi:hypothetical protein
MESVNKIKRNIIESDLMLRNSQNSQIKNKTQKIKFRKMENKKEMRNWLRHLF